MDIVGNFSFQSLIGLTKQFGGGGGGEIYKNHL